MVRGGGGRIVKWITGSPSPFRNRMETRVKTIKRSLYNNKKKKKKSHGEKEQKMGDWPYILKLMLGETLLLKLASNPPRFE